MREYLITLFSWEVQKFSHFFFSAVRGSPRFRRHFVKGQIHEQGRASPDKLRVRRTPTLLVDPDNSAVQPTRKRMSRMVLPPKRCFSFRRISDLEICSSS